MVRPRRRLPNNRWPTHTNQSGGRLATRRCRIHILARPSRVLVGELTATLTAYVNATFLIGRTKTNLYTRRRMDQHRSKAGSLGSIKRDVKKKVLPRPDAEKIFVSRSSPLPVSVPLDSLERFVVACLPYPWLSSSGGDDADRVLDLASGPGIWVSTMVLLEARGLSLFLVIRGGIA